MRYVKALFLSLALVATLITFSTLKAQDLDNVTAGEEVQMEAADTGGLDSLDKSLDGVLQEGEAEKAPDDTSSNAADVATEATTEAPAAGGEVIDLADTSFTESNADTTAASTDATTEETSATTDTTAEATTEAPAATDEAAATTPATDAAAEDATASESAPTDTVEAAADASAATTDAPSETVATDEVSTADSTAVEPTDAAATSETESAPAESVEEKGVTADAGTSGISEDAIMDDSSTDAAITDSVASGEGGSETAETAAETSGDTTATSGDVPEVDLSGSTEESSASAEMTTEASAEPDVKPESSTGSMDDMIDDAMTSPAASAPVTTAKGSTASESMPVAPQSHKRAFSNEELVQQEETRHKALEIHAKETLKLADRAYQARDYAKAARLYEEALKHLGERADTQSDRTRAEKLSGKANYYVALELKKQGKLEDAEKAAQLSLDRKYRAAAKLLNAIQKERSMGPAAKTEAPAAAKPKAVWNQDTYKEGQKSIDQLLKEGKQRLAVEDLGGASERFEMVLKQDPYNSEAIRLLEKTAIKKYDRATAELDTTRRNMMYDVRDTWNPRDYAVGSVTKGGPEGDRDNKAIQAEESEADQIEKRMDKVIIPEIDFRQFNIIDVVDFFQNASFANAGADGKGGVNFILNLGAQGGGGGGKAAEDKGEFSESTDEDTGTAGGAASVDDIPLVNFKARDISLFKALKMVTQNMGLRYVIQDGVVVIQRKNVATDQLLTRLYDVLPTLIDRVKSFDENAMGGGDAGGDGSDAGIADEPAADTGRVDLKEFFSKMGVEWPDGATISYVPSIGRLIVKNTEQNLGDFEKILNLINILPSQIEIEARFVEVNQTEANELGFEWMLGDDWEVAQKTSSSGSILGTAQYIQVKADDNGGLTKGLRFMEDMTLDSPADDIVTVASVLTNPELDFVIHALQQKGNADLLSAPKVTTQSGVAARISVVTEYVYPTEFTVTPITGTSDNGTTTIVGGVVEPSSFNMREVGVVLDVTPEVTADGKMISLVMSPKVVTEPTWKNYGSTYTAPDGSTQQLTMEQPFFHTRSVETQVLIYNGATVVMGGMINESRTEVEDKVPFLGDIPIIGRLFQSKYESTDKRNLLIFVTARLVDPSGKALVTPDIPIPEMAKSSAE